VAWNLARMAEALLPLRAAPDDEPALRRAVAEATEVIEAFQAKYAAAWLRMRRAKLGLRVAGIGEAGDATADAALADDWLSLMHEREVDFTLGWRRLADAAAGDEAPLRALFGDAPALDGWLARWRARCAADDAAAPAGDAGGAGAGAGAGATAAASAARAERLRATNPFVIPRNQRVEQALAAASDEGDLAPFERLLAALRRPFDEAPELAPFAEPAPRELTAAYQTFCGT
jgi:serine/tyrosine/threonine adenylyltransferase